MNYRNQFKQFPDEKLFDILINKADYQPEAVEAARAEIKSRGIEDQFDSYLKAKANAPQDFLAIVPALIKRSLENVRTSLSHIFDYRKIASGEDVVRGLALAMLLIALLTIPQLYREFEYAKTGALGDNSDSLITGVFGLMITALASILLWRMNKVGWILGVIYLWYTLLVDGVMYAFKVIESQYFYNEPYLIDSLPLLFVLVLLFGAYHKRTIKRLMLDNQTIFISTALIIAYSISHAVRLYHYMHGLIYGG